MESSTPVEIPRTTHILILKTVAFGLHVMTFCLGLSSVWGNDNMHRDWPDRGIPDRTKTLEVGDDKIKVNVTMPFNCFRCHGIGSGDTRLTQLIGFTFCVVASMLFALFSLLCLLCEHGHRYFFVRKCDRVVLIIIGIWMLLSCFFLLYSPLDHCSSISINTDSKITVSQCYRSFRFPQAVVSTLFGIVSAFLYFAAAFCACRLEEPEWMKMADLGIPPQEAHKYRIAPDSEASVRSQTAPGPSQRSLPHPQASHGGMSVPPPPPPPAAP